MTESLNIIRIPIIKSESGIQSYNTAYNNLTLRTYTRRNVLVGNTVIK